MLRCTTGRQECGKEWTLILQTRMETRTRMVLVDAHSKWIEIELMNSTTAEATIVVLREWFSSYGLPEELVSDNGPQFISQEFAVFMKQNGIKHTLTPPYHPASNGAAERIVQILKRALSKFGTAGGEMVSSCQSNINWLSQVN